MCCGYGGGEKWTVTFSNGQTAVYKSEAEARAAAGDTGSIKTPQGTTISPKVLV